MYELDDIKFTLAIYNFLGDLWGKSIRNISKFVV